MNEYEQIKLQINDYKLGLLTYDELVAVCQPIVDVMNIKNADIAKRHGMKTRKIFFKSIIRNTY